MQASSPRSSSDPPGPLVVSERLKIVLVCEDCGARNYKRTKARKVGEIQERLELKKFCPACGKHTVHRESR